MSFNKYGFDWGPMTVERMAHIEGRGYVVSIRGPKGHDGPEVQVLVSEKGRAITAYPLRDAKVFYRAHNTGQSQEKELNDG